MPTSSRPRARTRCTASDVKNTKFYEYVFSDPAKAALTDAGFEPP